MYSRKGSLQKIHHILGSPASLTLCMYLKFEIKKFMKSSVSFFDEWLGVERVKNYTMPCISDIPYTHSHCPLVFPTVTQGGHRLGS